LGRSNAWETGKMKEEGNGDFGGTGRGNGLTNGTFVTQRKAKNLWVALEFKEKQKEKKTHQSMKD